VQLLTPDIRNAAELSAAFQVAVAVQAEALLVGGPALMNAERTPIVEFATRAGLPLAASDRLFAAIGGLSSYGSNRLGQYRRAAVYVDKILQGARPAEIPVEQPSLLELGRS
jgi:putative ABC transport system substrate-binding protein